jgi:hypothetical protein
MVYRRSMPRKMINHFLNNSLVVYCVVACPRVVLSTRGFFSRKKWEVTTTRQKFLTPLTSHYLLAANYDLSLFIITNRKSNSKWISQKLCVLHCRTIFHVIEIGSHVANASVFGSKEQKVAFRGHATYANILRRRLVVFPDSPFTLI